MPACVESIFYVSNEENNRFVPWHGLGTSVEEAPNSKEALELAGLDWKVEQHDVYADIEGQHILVPGFRSNVRNSDSRVLGIVSDRYKIVQNDEAFAFTDALLENDDEEVKYETAGSLKNGRTIWLLARLPKKDILGDEFNNYVCFTNSHDGKGAVTAFCTPIRIVCNNTLNLAMSRADRHWAMRHVGDMNSKLEEARETLQLANRYIDELSDEAGRLSDQHITDAQVEHWLNELFPITDDMSDRKKANNESAKNTIILCYNRPDIAQFKGTGWGLINAVSDFVGHATPARNSPKYWENNWGSIMNGHPVMDRVYTMIKKAA